MAEKKLTDLPRDLRLLYTKGTEAFQRDNFEYAIDLFNQVLNREPLVFECRKALRASQLRKAGRGKGFFKKMLSTAGSQPAVTKGQIALRNDPVAALQIAETVLNHDPNNAGAHRLVVEAARALELPRTAVLSLEVLFANSPKDVSLAIQLARALGDTGEPGRAEKILADLYRQFPDHNDLAQALKDLSARTTLDEGGYEALADGTGSYRDILKDKDEAALLEQQNRQVQPEDAAERLIKDYEVRLKAEPNNLKVLRNLAELYTQKKDFAKALGFYAQIKASDIGADSSLDRAIADTMVRQFDHKISQLDPQAPDHGESVAKLQTEKQAYQIAECQKRVERFPTDLQIRFEMGLLYFQAGKIGEATREFQKARENPHRKTQAMSYLAQCFSRRGIYDLAASTLQEAIKEKVVFDDEKKELLYLLGGVLEKMDKRGEAIAQYKQIYAVDAGYKDVEAKILGELPPEGS